MTRAGGTRSPSTSTAPDCRPWRCAAAAVMPASPPRNPWKASSSATWSACEASREDSIGGADTQVRAGPPGPAFRQQNHPRGASRRGRRLRTRGSAPPYNSAAWGNGGLVYFLNLSFLQFLAVFGTISALSVALYLLDRSRRKLVVSTLRFWIAAEQPAVAARRRRVQQPWSLVLQLASMALLLLAIGQLRLGTPAQAGRDHVIVLDTSSWMAGRAANRTLMDAARDRARQYLKALPVRDRVMLVRADAMATPATAFELDRRKIEDAITASEPGATALNLDQALVFARHVQGQEGHRPGEIAFIGPGRTAPRDPGTTSLPRNLRVIPIPDNVENVGLRKVGMRRSGADSELWEIYVAVRNYGARPHTVTLSLDLGPGGPAGRVAAGSRLLPLGAGAESEASFEYRTSAAGMLGVHISPHDSYPNDDQAELELPAFTQVAESNIETLQAAKVKKMVSICPHCVRTIGTDWREAGATFEIEHHSELLARLADRLPSAAAGAVRETVVYHDPCYLGRYREKYDEPRAVIARTAAVVEAGRARERSFCCGAGGGQMF